MPHIQKALLCETTVQIGTKAIVHTDLRSKSAGRRPKSWGISEYGGISEASKNLFFNREDDTPLELWILFPHGASEFQPSFINYIPIISNGDKPP